MSKLFIVLVILNLPLIRSDMPGTYYWRPRLGIDLAIPTTDQSMTVMGKHLQAPSEQSIRDGYIVLVERYGTGMLLVAIASGVSSGMSHMDSLNPMKAAFYTNSYRWALRYFSMVPGWLAGNGKHFAETTKVWPKRFAYMDSFVPKWLRKLIFYVPEKEWEKEYEQYRKYKKYSEGAFGKSYRFPSQVFDDFKSEISIENSAVIPPEVSNSESQGVFEL